MHWIDPDHLPEITGIVDQFLVNKHGEADGFLLTDGEEVHVPPHLSARLLRDVRPGSEVKVRGVRPRGVHMVAAVAIDTPNGRLLALALHRRREPLCAEVTHPGEVDRHPGGNLIELHLDNSATWSAWKRWMSMWSNLLLPPDHVHPIHVDSS